MSADQRTTRGPSGSDAAGNNRQVGDHRPSQGPVGRQLRLPKMAELVASDLRRRIIRGELAEGQALPSEAGMLAEFGVSRSTLREAFRILEAESLITVRGGPGGGARVMRPSLEVAVRYAGLVLGYRGTTLQDVWEARLFLEPPAAGMLARQRTRADLHTLRDALAEHDAASEPAEAIRLHNDFHLMIARLAGNYTLTLLIRMLSEIIERTTWSRLEPTVGSPAMEEAERSTVKVHRALVDLIEAKDTAGAEDLWHRHLQAASAYLWQGDGKAVAVNLFG